MSRLGKIGVYGPKTRNLQRKISFEVFGLSWKTANVYLYMGDRNNPDPSIGDIGTTVFWEVPDRAYAEEAITIPVGMEPIVENKTDFSRFGILNPMQDETLFRVHIDDYTTLGRKLVVGDVFEIPFFERDGKRSFWEVNDVDDSQEVEKYIHIIHATPLDDKRTTREIPIDNSNSDIYDTIMPQQDDEYSDIVPTEDVTFEEDPDKESVDYRNNTQSSFLDDPNKEF